MPVPRMWCINNCFIESYKYSCAVDALFDCFYFAMYRAIEWTAEKSPVLELFSSICDARWSKEIRSELTHEYLTFLRDGLWDRLLSYSGGLLPKGTSAARIDDTLDTLCSGYGDKTVFCFECIAVCKSCQHVYSKTVVCPIILTDFNIQNSSMVLESVLYKMLTAERSCPVCHGCIQLMIRETPKFVVIELATRNYDGISVNANMLLGHRDYRLTGVIFATGTHFVTGILSSEGDIVLLDDLNTERHAQFFRVGFRQSNMVTILPSDNVQVLVYTAECSNGVDLYEVLSSSMIHCSTPDYSTNMGRKRNATNEPKDQPPAKVETAELAFKDNTGKHVYTSADMFLGGNCKDNKELGYQSEFNADVASGNCGNNEVTMCARRGPSESITEIVASIVGDVHKDFCLHHEDNTASENVNSVIDDIVHDLHEHYVSRTKCVNEARLTAHTVPGDGIQNEVAGLHQIITSRGNTDIQSFQEIMKNAKQYWCRECGKLLFGEEIRYRSKIEELVLRIDILCNLCSTQLRQVGSSTISKDNGFDVEQVPKELTNLTMVEKRLVSLVHPFLSIFVLPGGQLCEAGNIIHFPVPLFEFHKELFPISQMCSNLILVRKEGCTISVNNLIRVRCVLEAMKWLYVNNDYFKRADVADTIAYLEGMVRGISSAEDPTDIMPLETVVMEADPYLPKIDVNRFVATGSVVSLPRLKTQPVNLFKADFVEELSFPWLLPMGKFGYSWKRKTKISMQKYFKSRLLSCDKRFQKDHMYLFYALCRMEFDRLRSAVGIACSLKSCSKSNHVNTKSLDNGLSSSYFEKSFAFLSSIRGYGAYMRKQLRLLLAKVKLLGPPTWFVSLSAADCSDLWPELFEYICDDKSESTVTSDERWRLLRANPVIVSRFFHRRWKHFLKYVLKGNAVPIGEVTDYYKRVEFQQRGSPHIHLFLWIKNAPRFEHGCDSDKICQFVDRYTKTTLPDPNLEPEEYELAVRVQMHKHVQHGCMKASSRCRFDYPKPLCKETRLRTSSDIGNPARLVITKRTTKQEQMLNAYNREILLSWRANHDIQFVGSFYGLCAYICAYMCKSEPQCLQNVISEVLASLPANASLRKRLFKVGCAVFSQRQVSAQEAAWRILELPYVESSRTTVYINAYPPRSRIRMLKSHRERQKMPDDCTDIFQSGIIEYYSCRPNSPDWNNMSLYDFAANYRTMSECSRRNSVAELPECGKIVLKRSKEAAVLLPKFTLPEEKESFFYSRLLVYLPWRTEGSFLSNFSTVEECFLHNITNLDPRWRVHEELDSEVFRNLLLIRELDTSESLFDDTLTESESVTSGNVCQVNEYEMFHPTDTVGDLDQMLDESSETEIPVKLNAVDFLTADHLTEMSDQCYLDNMSTLTSEQRSVIKAFDTHYCNDIDTRKDPLVLFISGPGGVGKSHLIRILKEHLTRITKKNSVLLTATTGVASHNIGGITVHSALRLPIHHSRKRDGKYVPLSASNLHDLRVIYKDIDTIIIDECSMLSYSNLEAVHLRLREIFDNEIQYGGINIVFVGDLYQLRPVCGNWLFKRSAQSDVHLWSSFVRPIFLTTNKRQSDDQEYFDMLNRIRIGQPVLKDLLALQSRIGVHETNCHFDDAIRIYPKRKQCQEYNRRMTERFSRNSANGILVSISEDKANNLPKGLSIEDIVSENASECGGLEKELAFVRGGRMMLNRNVSVACGLVNGQCGTVINCSVSECGVEHCYIKFDDPRISKSPIYIGSNSDEGSVMISKVTARFYAKHEIEVFRTQFPLIPCWAVTIHKVQGQTLDKAVINIGREIFGPAQTYVALSRIRTLSGVAIEEHDPTKIWVNKYVPAEMQRLHGLL